MGQGRSPRLPLRVCRPPVPAVWEQRGRTSAGAGGGQPRGQGGRYFHPGGFQQGPLGPLAAQGQPDRNPAGQEGWGSRGGSRAPGRATRQGSGEPGPRPSPGDPSHHSEHRGASGPLPASLPSLTLAVPCPLAALSRAQFPRGARGPGDVEWWGQDSGQLPARGHTGQLPGLADSRAGGPAGARQRAAHHVS